MRQCVLLLAMAVSSSASSSKPEEVVERFVGCLGNASAALPTIACDAVFSLPWLKAQSEEGGFMEACAAYCDTLALVGTEVVGASFCADDDHCAAHFLGLTGTGTTVECCVIIELDDGEISRADLMCDA